MMIQSFFPIWLMAIICILIIVLKRKGTWAFIRQIVIAILLFALNLRIAIPSENVEKEITNIDILFVVDTTISMVAEDYNGDNPRLDGVRADIISIAEAFPGARYSIINFDNLATRLLPYTEYIDPLVTTVNNLRVQTEYYANGTSLNTPIKEMEVALNRDPDATNDPSYHIVFFISDGEENTNKKLESYSGLAENIEYGAVLGYGTSSGGKMKAEAYIGSGEEADYIYYYDSSFNYRAAISKIDESNLNQIADDMGVEYYHMTKPSDVDKVIKDITNSVENGDIKTVKIKTFGYIETYYYFAIALALFLVYDAFWYKHKLRLKV